MEKTREDYTANISVEYRLARWTQVNKRLEKEKLKRMTKVDLMELYNEIHAVLDRSERDAADSLCRIEKMKQEIESQSKIIAAMVNMALLIPHGKG